MTDLEYINNLIRIRREIGEDEIICDDLVKHWKEDLEHLQSIKKKLEKLELYERENK